MSSDPEGPGVATALDDPVELRGVTDENQHQAFLEANRSPLQKHYDDFVAAKRVSPSVPSGVIVRPGVGRVLAVGGIPIR